MRVSVLRCGAVVLVCLLSAACKDRPEPVKPVAPLPIVCCIDF